MLLLKFFLPERYLQSLYFGGDIVKLLSTYGILPFLDHQQESVRVNVFIFALSLYTVFRFEPTNDTTHSLEN